MLRRFLFILFLLPSALLAQNYPPYESIYINDYADLIDSETENVLTGDLTKLRDETGIEVTLLTVESWQAFGGHNRMERFATALFNEWGIGDAERNDGILILIARAEREIRIELGSGYPENYNTHAGYVIEKFFLPPFQKQDYDQGVRDGTQAVINEIALRHRDGLPPPEPENQNLISRWIIAAFALLGMGAFYFARKNRIGNRPCPMCGQKHLKRERTVIEGANKYKEGHGEETIWCESCTYRDTGTYTISRKSKSSGGGSFGGGSSSGGGASGRW